MNSRTNKLNSKIKLAKIIFAKQILSVRLGNVFCSIRHYSLILNVGPMELLQTNEEKRRPMTQCEQCFAI